MALLFQMIMPPRGMTIDVRGNGGGVWSIVSEGGPCECLEANQKKPSCG